MLRNQFPKREFWIGIKFQEGVHSEKLKKEIICRILEI